MKTDVSPCRILVVEDHRDSAEITSLVLGREGFDVVVASGYRVALETAQASRFDVLLCDIGLSDGDGCDLLRKVKAMYNVPAVAITGHGFERDRRRCEEAGFDRFLLKPVGLEELTSTIRALTGPLPCGSSTVSPSVPPRSRPA